MSAAGGDLLVEDDWTRHPWRRPSRRGGCPRDPEAGPGTCFHWWQGCPKARARGCYLLWLKAQPAP